MTPSSPQNAFIQKTHHYRTDKQSFYPMIPKRVDEKGGNAGGRFHEIC